MHVTSPHDAVPDYVSANYLLWKIREVSRQGRERRRLNRDVGCGYLELDCVMEGMREELQRSLEWEHFWD